MERERAFYSSRGLPCPKDVPIAGSEMDVTVKTEVDQHAEADYHRQDEQVSFFFKFCVEQGLTMLYCLRLTCSWNASAAV
jgi:hypothetical protein